MECVQLHNKLFAQAVEYNLCNKGEETLINQFMNNPRNIWKKNEMNGRISE